VGVVDVHKHLPRGRVIPPSAGTGFAEAKETKPKTRLNVKVRNFILSVIPYVIVGAQSRISGF